LGNAEKSIYLRTANTLENVEFQKEKGGMLVRYLPKRQDKKQTVTGGGLTKGETLLEEARKQGLGKKTPTI